MSNNRIAVIGCGIGYSRSPEIHAAVSAATGVDIVCETADIAESDFAAAVEGLYATHRGFYVTKPYKQAIKKFCVCDGLGAVNVVRSFDRRAINTDGAGFTLALDHGFVGWKNEVESVLVLGAGGAAWAAITALKALGKKVYVLARSNISAAKLCSKTGAELYANQPAELCVNCTSSGTDDDVMKALCVVPDFKYAYEMYYAAESTPFTERAARAGCKTAIGLDMLIYQAIEGDKFLFDINASTQEIFEKVKQILYRSKK